MVWIYLGIFSINKLMLYFVWFDLPVSLFPDTSLLKQRFLSKSKLFHPDKFTLASEDEKAKALESSGFNNQAYKVLSDVDARIQYILGEYGLLKDDKEAMPPDFLMKMMVFNEAISDLDDDPSSFLALKDDLAAWESELKAELDYCASLIPLDIEKARHLKTYFFKRKYYLRIRDNFSKFANP
jgi:molecular chaperone HscB